MPTTPRKKLIEVALPLEAINVASAREKSIRHGHPSTMHLWWSRKPLATCRAVIFSSLVDDPDSPDALPAFVEACRNLPKGANAALNDTPRMRLFDFIEMLVKWESTTDEKVLKTARDLINIATEGNPPPLLDPFAGGGSIPLEAQRLGLEAHASDLNPVAVMINKAQIEIPPRFANQPPVNPRDRQQMSSGTGWKGAAGLAADVRYYGEWMREKAWERIGHLYPTHNGETVIAWIWARTVKSPNPTVDFHVPLTNKFELSKKKNRRAWIEPNYELSTKRVMFTVKHERDGNDPKTIQDGTVNQRGARCIVSGVAIPFEYIRAEGKAGRIGAQLMAIVTEGQGSRNYYSPTSEHEHVASKALAEWMPVGEIPEHALGFRVQLYGMDAYNKLFTSRQLVALTTFSDLVAEAREQAHQDALAAGLTDDTMRLQHSGFGARAYAEAVSVYLAFAVDKAANLWSSLTSWMSDRGALRETFARQALSMIWDYAEANPFSDSGGNFSLFVTRIADAIDYLNSGPSGTAIQENATSIANSKSMLISTDPPYYDNIGYADLSDFFYIWLRRSLGFVYPDVLNTLLSPKDAELIATPYRQRDTGQTPSQFFESGLSRVFEACSSITSPDFPLTIYYAFKQTESEAGEELSSSMSYSSTGWETILIGLVEAGFTIDGTWPVRTESTGRIRNIGANALASSIILVCRPRSENAPTTSRRQFVDSLRRELPAALKNMQSGNIAPVDLAQASIGPGMAIYSRYSKVLEADGSALTVRAALGLINQELDAYLAEQDGSIDPDTRFAVAWFEQFSFNEGEFGHADVLARAKNTSVAGVEAAGLVVAGRGKVKLKHWTEYDPGAWDPKADRRPTVWEAVHHLIERLNAHGESGAAGLLLKMNAEMAAEARALAYRLYSICERKGWAEHALEYNKLVVSWTGVADQAAADRAAEVRGDGTKQLGLFE